MLELPGGFAHLVPPPGLRPGPDWGPRRSPDPSPNFAPSNSKTWIRAWCLPRYSNAPRASTPHLIGIYFWSHVTPRQPRNKYNFQQLTWQHSPRSSVGRAKGYNLGGRGIKSHTHPSFFFLVLPKWKPDAL